MFFCFTPMYGSNWQLSKHGDPSHEKCFLTSVSVNGTSLCTSLPGHRFSFMTFLLNTELCVCVCACACTCFCVAEHSVLFQKESPSTSRQSPANGHTSITSSILVRYSCFTPVATLLFPTLSISCGELFHQSISFLKCVLYCCRTVVEYKFTSTLEWNHFCVYGNLTVQRCFTERQNELGTELGKIK